MPIASYTPHEIASGRGRLERTLFAATMLAGLAFSLAEANLFYVALVIVAAGLHLAAAWRNRELYVRRLVLNAGLLAAGLALLAKHVMTGEDLLLTLGHYVIVILLCKLFEHKQRRDHVQILVLGALLVVAASLISQALWFAVLAAGYVAALCRSAMVLTFQRAMEAAPGASPWPRRALAARLAAVLAAMLAAGVVTFLIVPRSTLGAAILRSHAGRRTTGFADTVRLGDSRPIYTSDRVVLQVRPVDVDGRTATWNGPMYLRGKVFDEYSSSRWTASRAVRPGWAPRPPPSSLLRGLTRLEVSMVPSLLPTAFAPHPCVAMRCDLASFSARPTEALQYELQGVPGSEPMVRYTASVVARALDDVERDYLHDADESGDVPPEPPVPPAVVQLARQWCGELLDRRQAAGDDDRARGELDLAIARRLAARLADDYEYSLDLSLADSGRDGVEDFLFHLRRGHCEYFASALTVMCQSLNVRARLATGFRVDAADPQGRYFVPERAAHAWTEVAPSGGPWTTIDATPAASMAAAHRGTWLMRMTQWYRDLEFKWYDRVIGYDDEARRELTGRAQGLLASAWQAVKDTAGETAAALRDLVRHGRVSGPLAWAVLGAASATVVVVGVVLWGRRGAGRGAGPAARRRRALRPAFVGDLLKVVKRRGVRVLPSDTFREVTVLAAERLALPTEELAGLCDLYYRMRWGGAEAGKAELLAARTAVRRMRKGGLRPPG